MRTEPRKPKRRRKTVRTPEIAPGAVIRGRFELLAEAGRGGLSAVYKARDLVAVNAGLGEATVALKIVVAEAGTDPDVVALMHREARRLRDLVHENIVRVYDMDVDGDAHFMVMEHLEGQSLARALIQAEGHRLAEPQVDRLVNDVAAALSFAHGRNVVHADLKPGNVFIERSGLVKLIDFNIAHPVIRATRGEGEDTVQILGRLGAVTPLYASPQRLAGAEPCEGDDVYSLALLTYIALTGKRPFGRKTAQEAIEEKITAEVPPGLPRWRWAALSRGLAFDDKDRTPTAARFAEEFTGAGGTIGAARRLLGL